jgi:uncharacterized protein YdbL (DUF1318 family)
MSEIDFALSKIRDALAALGVHMHVFINKAWDGHLPSLPAADFWFTGTSLFLAGSFAFTIAVGLIGIKEMISQRKFMVLMVFAILLSGLAWRTAAKQEEDSAKQGTVIDSLNGKLSNIRDSNKAQEDQLGTLATQNKNLQETLSKIANAANLNPNQSAETLANEIIKRLPGAPWHLTDDEKTKLGNIFDSAPTDSHFPIDVEALIGSTQSQMYKDDLATTIHLHHWDVTGGVDTSIKADLEGLYIAVKDGTTKETLPPDVVVMANMLNSAGIKFGFGTYPSVPDKGVKLLIGTKWTN